MTFKSEGDFYQYHYQNGADMRILNDGGRARDKVNAYHTYRARASKRGTGNMVGADSALTYGDPFVLHGDTARSLRNQVIIDARSTFDKALLISDLVFAKSTLQAATARAKALLKLTRQLRRGDVKAIKKAYGDGSPIPSAWLEWNFVYRPLAGTIAGVAEVLDNPLSSAPCRVMARLQEPESKDFSYGWEKNTAHLNFMLYYCDGSVFVENPNQGLIDALGVTDILGLAIDVAPWSWAIGYFTNVTDWIENLNPKYNRLGYVNFRHGYKAETSYYCENSTSSPTEYASQMHCSMMRRIPGPLPGVSFDMIDVNLSLRQATYLFSAITLTLKGKFK